jgi:hypothetical protein
MAQMLIVDDERSFRRPENSGTTIYARNNKEAIHALMTMDFFEVSLDHDLGPKSEIRPLVQWIANMEKFLWEQGLRYIYIHSMNPVGADWVEKALEKTDFHIKRITLNQLGYVYDYRTQHYLYY